MGVSLKKFTLLLAKYFHFTSSFVYLCCRPGNSIN